MKRILRALCALLMLAATLPGGSVSARAAPAAARPATLRALGHSAFLITTPAGRRLLIDPYTSDEWPGLRFPRVEADRVLISHPHWDHSGWKGVQGSPKVTRGPASLREKDHRVIGLAGRHARPGGAEIGFANTVYVVETGGVRICHPGDNGPLPDSPGLAEAIGVVDVLLLPIDSERRVLGYDEARAWVEALSPRIVIPMHYRLPGLAFEQVTGLGTIEEWLSGQPGHRRLQTDLVELDPSDPGWPPRGAARVLVLTLPGERVAGPVEASPGRAEALEALRKAEIAVAGGDLAGGLELFTRAAALDPDNAEVLQKIGFLHLGARRPDRAAEFLLRAARQAGLRDTATASLSWLGAGMAFDLMGNRTEAAAAYRAVIGMGVNDEQQVEQARRYLEHPYEED
ncbi:MAG TPA: MBL fold metallo-hydrolase [Candidatus Polarisedimenticolia bacterium]|nr:MBL fold metallo-hydrolase [Candidatus Polarisedimenticolia bacterium]